MNRTLFVVNPAAGRGEGGRVGRFLEDFLQTSNDSDSHIVYTHSRGEATQIASQMNYDAVVAVGGDGTINEVVNGIIGSEKRLGVIPAGSGNDSIKSLGIPVRTEEAIAVIRRGDCRRVDAGEVEWNEEGPSHRRRYFINGAGFGFDAAVAARAQTIPHLRGTLLYLTAVLLSLVDYRAPMFEIAANGVVLGRDHQLLIAVGNGTCAGGGFFLTPDAKPDDGLLDLCAISARSAPKILGLIPKVLKARHLGSAGVVSARAERLRVTGSAPFAVHTDGEVVSLKALAVDVTVQRAALDVLYTAS